MTSMPSRSGITMSSRTMSGRTSSALAQRLLAAAGGDDAEALLAEGDRDELRDPRFVVGDEDERLGAHGRLRYEMTW